MIRRLLRSRGTRRFFRDRIAVAALGVISLYFLVAVLVVFGVLTPTDAQERVLPSRIPGFLEQPSLEKRFQNAEWYIGRVEQKLDFAERRGLDLEPLIDELTMAERRVVDLDDAEEYRTLIDSIWELYDPAIEKLDLRDMIKEDIYQLRQERKAADEGDAANFDGDPRPTQTVEAEIEAKEAELKKMEAEIDTDLDVLEAKILELWPMPQGWDGAMYAFRTFLGSNANGQSIAVNAFYSTKVALQVGIITAVVCVLLGTLLGSAAAFFGGLVDHVVMWLVSTLSSIPYLVLLAVLVFMFSDSIFDNTDNPFLALVPLYVAFCLTFWIGTCRVIRGEVMKIKELEYVQAATSIGFSKFYILLKHAIPNTTHIMFINFSLLVIGAIKSEVILTFLGLGVKGQPSWGVMIANGKDEVVNFAFWEIGSATVLMFGLVLAFNIVSDALQDAFDPKHVT